MGEPRPAAPSWEPLVERARTEGLGNAAGAGSPRPVGASIIARNAVAVVLAQVEAELGLDGVDAVLAAVDDRRLRVESLAPGTWTPVQYVSALFQAAAVTAGDPAVCRRAGASVFTQPHMASVVEVLRRLQRPAQALEVIADTAATEAAAVAISVERVRGDTATVSLTVRAPLSPDRLFCGYASGLLSSVPGIFGLAPTTVVETECQGEGAPSCRFDMAWGAAATARAPAAADPDAVAERVAAGLANVADLDRTLADVVAGATSACGSRGLLWVGEDGGRLLDGSPGSSVVLAESPGIASTSAARLFTYAMDEEEARRTAQWLGPLPLADGPSGQAGTWTVAAVDDGIRPIGWLAVDGAAPGASAEQHVASWAAMASIAVRGAAVRSRSKRLSSATSALQDLTAGLARAESTGDVARALARSGPLVLGGRRVLVATWCATTGTLVEAARTVPRPSLRTDPQPVVACRSFMERLVRSGSPVALSARHTEPVVEDLCRIAGFDRGMVVPVVSAGTCYGVLVVDVEPGALPPASACQRRCDVATGLANVAGLAFRRAALAEQAVRGEHHDAVTGLADGRLLRVHARQALAAAHRQGRSVGMLCVDIDGFGAHVARCGRSGADRILVEVARRLSRAVRVADVVARIGSDEFAVLLPSASTAEELAVVAARVADSFAAPLLLGGAEVAVTVGIGATLSAPGDREADLMARGDRAMVVAKERGRGQTWFDT